MVTSCFERVSDYDDADLRLKLIDGSDRIIFCKYAGLDYNQINRMTKMLNHFIYYRVSAIKMRKFIYIYI